MSTPMVVSEMAADRRASVSPPGPRIVCISTDVHASAALQATVSAILPMARVVAADTSIVRSAPDADCVVLAVGRLYEQALALSRELRARGFDRSIILVVESLSSVPVEDLTHLGVTSVLAEASVAAELPGALLDGLAAEMRIRGTAGAEAITSSLRRLQARASSGDVAHRLQHQLNNPLAALLAEAQLLELEVMSPEHTASVRRIVELCRRVIEVSRSIEGMGGRPEF